MKFENLYVEFVDIWQKIEQRGWKSGHLVKKAIVFPYGNIISHDIVYFCGK